MILSSLSCPNCGGPIQKEDNNCKYCNASINISPDYKQVKLIGFPALNVIIPPKKEIVFAQNVRPVLLLNAPLVDTMFPWVRYFALIAG